MVLVLSRRSRAFIITQDGLKGFLLACHSNPDSFFYELGLSWKFGQELNSLLSCDDALNLIADLKKLSQKEEKELFLRLNHPAIYITFLK